MASRKARTMNRRKVLQATGISGLTAIAGCMGGSNSGNAVNFAGGATSSAGYNMVTGFSQLLRENSEDLNINSQSTGGTVANIRLVADGDYDIGQTSSTDLLHGVRGEGDFDEAYDHQQLVTFNTIPLPICCTLEEHEDLTYIEDLPGTSMGGSPPGTIDQPALVNYLDANDLWEGEDTIDFSRNARDQGLDQLDQGQIDAHSGYAINNSPPPWMNEWLNRRDDAKLLFPESVENVENYIDAQPGAIKWELQLEEFGVGWENSAYSDQDTVTVSASTQQLFTTPDLADETANQIVSKLFEYSDSLPEYHDLWNGFSGQPSEMAVIFNTEEVPFHPGAAEALQEEGIEVEHVGD